MVFLGLFLLLTFQVFGCLYGCKNCTDTLCLDCENGFTLTNGICVSTGYLKNPGDNEKCLSDICIFDYLNSKETLIEISSLVTTLLLPEHQVSIKMNEGQIKSLLEGQFIVFLNQIQVNNIITPNAQLDVKKELTSTQVECLKLRIEGKTTITNLKAEIIELNFDNINEQNIHELIIETNTTIKIHVDEDQKKSIEKLGVHLLGNTLFSLANSNFSLEDLLSLTLIYGDEEIELPYHFYTNMCNNKTSAFLPSEPEDKSTSCPDYIFVKPTTIFWWISAVVMLCCIAGVFVFGASFLIYRHIKSNKK